MNGTSLATVALAVLGLAALGLALGEPARCPASELEVYEFTRDIERGGSQEEELLAVTLDSDICAATQVHFADLRVVDAAAEPVPYRLEKVTENRSERVRQSCSSKVQSLRENDDNSIEIVIRLDDKAPAADGMVLHTPLRDYERQVRVFGSGRGADWQPLVASATVFDYSRYLDVSNREIALPRNDFRQLKLVIAEATATKESPLLELTRQFHGERQQQRTERTTIERRPLKIDRIELWHEVSRQRVRRDRKTAYPIVEFTSEEDANEQQTILHVVTRREPLTRFTLATSSANFSRLAVVQVPVERGVRTTWVEVGRATVSLFRFRDFERRQLAIDFPEQRQREYRIVIRNGDDRPLQITAVAAEGNVYRALFFAAADSIYRVAYGSATAAAASYDTAALAAALGQGYQPIAAALGPEVNNADFSGPGALQPGALLNHPLLLGAAICLLVIVLALVLFRAGRRIDNLPGA